MPSSPSDLPDEIAAPDSARPAHDSQKETAPDFLAASPRETQLEGPRDSLRSSLRDSRLRPILCCAGALGVGLALAPVLLKPPVVPVADAGASIPEIALARENTLLVTTAMPPGALLRGRIRLMAGDTDALGRARTGGQVARHLVEEGARVQRGDAVVEISSGAGQRVAPNSERRQNRAEQSQIAAADAQTALAQKINLAQSRLIAAQERVASAQAQTAVARDVVRRLQNGQSVASSEIPANFRGADPSEPAARPSRSRRDRGAGARPNRATQIAARQAEAARDAAQESLRALQSARDTLADTQSAAKIADDKGQNAAKVVTDVEARFDNQKATGADVEAARSAQKEAQSGVNAADQALIFAKAEIGKREKNAAAAQSYAASSAAQAAALSRSDAQVTDSETTSKAASKAASASESPSRNAVEPGSTAGRVTLDRAIRFAGAALDESRRASREAERIHDEIESYQGQVTRSHTRIEAATQDLAQAQQSVMDSTPRPRFTACYAPSSGIITWISRLAREVGAGDAVFGITRSQRAAARFEDKSGLWRSIRPGAVLGAFVVDAPAMPEKTPSGGAASNGEQNSGAPDATATPESIAQLGAGHAIQLKMTGVQTPTTAGEAAKLTGVPLSAAQNSGALPDSALSNSTLPDGAQILVSMPLPGQKAALSVPASTLVQRGGFSYLAVLAPLTQQEIRLQNAQTQQGRPLPEASGMDVATTSGAPTSGATTSGAGPAAVVAAKGEAFRLRWTRVEVGRSDGIRLEIRGGVAAGVRIVSQPEDLEAMGFAPPSGPQPTVLDKKNATSAADATSNPAPDGQVLVRLTPNQA